MLSDLLSISFSLRDTRISGNSFEGEFCNQFVSSWERIKAFLVDLFDQPFQSAPNLDGIFCLHQASLLLNTNGKNQC